MSDQFKEKAMLLNVPQRERILVESSKKSSVSIYRFAEKVTRNFAFAALLIVTVYAVKEARIPDGNIVYTAASSISDIPWEDTLGRIQFVNAAFYPENVADNIHIGMPDITSNNTLSVLHSWNMDEPYYSFKCNTVFAFSEGEVYDIEQEIDQTYTVYIRHKNNYHAAYHNLSSCTVKNGDIIQIGQILGESSNDEMIYSLYFDGIPVNLNAVFLKQSNT